MDRVLRHDGDYALIYMPQDVCAYAVFKYTGNFWQQISPNYFRKGNAVRKYNALIGTPTLINQPLN